MIHSVIRSIFGVAVVTSQKIIERLMDNRGTKSTLLKVVKAQRINGGGHSNNIMFKIYSTIGFSAVTGKSLSRPSLSKNNFITPCIPHGVMVRNLSSLSNTSEGASSDKIAYWLVGLVDAEACFRISILKTKSLKEGGNYKVRLYFQISLHRKDEKVLELMVEELKVGKIYRTKSRPDISELKVFSIKEIKLIVEFFDRYPLISQKFADYILFKEAYLLICNKQHLTNEGLQKVVSLRASSNWGLSKDLKEAFPNVEPAPRLQPNLEAINDEWLRGFISGEGNFTIRIIESKTHNLGYQVGLRFRVTQHCKDRLLMESIKNYFKCGHLSDRGDIIDFQVTAIKDIKEKIIPFFDRHMLLGVKYEDYQDFKLAAQIINRKEHLTEEGLTNLREIKSKMNRQREISIDK